MRSKRKKRNSNILYLNYIKTYNDAYPLIHIQFYYDKNNKSGYMSAYRVKYKSDSIVKYEEILKTSVYTSKFLSEIEIKSLFEAITKLEHLYCRQSLTVYCPQYWRYFGLNTPPSFDKRFKKEFTSYIKVKNLFEYNYLKDFKFMDCMLHSSDLYARYHHKYTKILTDY